jgi:hypothetical protein
MGIPIPDMPSQVGLTGRGPGPRTLSRSQFLQKKPGGTYSKYLSFINKRRTPAATGAPAGGGRVDPLAPMSPAAIDQIVNRFSGMYGAPVDDAHLQADAKAQLDPIIAAITGDINKRASTSTSAIAANAGALAKELGTIDYQAPYRTAKTDQANVDAALRASLAGQGGNGLADDLSKRLAMIDDPAVAATATGLADRGSALGTTELARGSTNLGSLIASAAAAGEYGVKQPGIAKLSGLQDIAGVNKQAVSDISDKTATLLGQIPTIVANLRSSNDAKRANAAQAAAQIYETLTGQNITKATAKAGLVNDAAKVTAETAPSYDATVSRSLGYRADQYGNPIGKQITPLPGYHVDAKSGAVTKDVKPAPVSKPKPLSTADRQKALDRIDEYYYGVPPKKQYDSSRHSFVDVPGTGVPAVDYHTAIANLVAGFGYSEQQATMLANTRYKPGEDGRPQSAAQIQAEKKAKQKAAAAAHDAAVTGFRQGETSTKTEDSKVPNSWNPADDPIVAPGPLGTGMSRTRSGRWVNTTFGAYVPAPGGR